MENMIVEKFFIKENDGVRVDSNDACAIYLVHDFELERFTCSVKQNMLSPMYQQTPIEILAPFSDIWNLIICFQGNIKKLRYSVEKIALTD